MTSRRAGVLEETGDGPRRGEQTAGPDHEQDDGQDRGEDREHDRGEGQAQPAYRPAADPDAATSTSRPLWLDVRIPHAAKIMLALCVAVFGALLYGTRRLDFYYDEWSFLDAANRWTLRSYFVPHNEHWSTVPMLVYKVLLLVNGAHSYVPFMGALLLFHASAAFLLFALVRRRCGDLLGLMAGTVLLCLGRGYDDIIWAFQIGFLGSIVFGLLALNLLGARPVAGRRRAAAGSTALLLALMSSGIGLFFLAAAALDLLLDRNRRRLLWTLITPSVAYVWWYLAFGRQGTAGDHSIFTFKTLEGLLGYTPAGIGSAAAGVFALSPLWAPIAFAALTATTALLVYRKRLNCGLAIPAAAGIVLQFTLTGLVRAQYGDSQATASRYVYIGAVFVLLILTEALRDALWRGLWRTVAPITAAAVVLAGASVLVHQERIRAKMLSKQKYELEITWLFRAAPGLSPNVVLDRGLLPVVTPALYYQTRALYGSPLPELTVSKLGSLPQNVVNSEMRLLMPLTVTVTQFANPPAAAGRAAVPGCTTTIASGGSLDVSALGGSDAAVRPIGPHASSRLTLGTWYVGDAPDGALQQWNASAGHGLLIRLPDTGLHLRWHLRVAVAAGSPVMFCPGGATPAT
ncbi:hypothetical protein KGA66_13720 [Actinocrinis puniceicyclus]|uniref:Uncharacterized protein n=1 Tax=Actinocrinis puniceicyclus TaxID=977794 RepID=A0A8J7WKQ4_9ACTN|nr:hypothetical protein [Actinocrinis puniceicyclus]MBS2964111.1 hypothetical protein [Actinocrinis puniceicyclus]